MGGGVICDIAGFMASTYLRGLDLGLMPTTLLAQTDASIGGKNGFNLMGYKNIVGTFYQPKYVLFDTNFLYTLPHKEILNGLSECIKHALVYSPELFHLLNENYKKIKKMDRNIINSLIRLSSMIKIEIVNKDERDKGLRKILNFGHTYGHAIEREFSLSHGEAIAIGMLISLKISRELKILSKDTYMRILDLFYKFDMPVIINKKYKDIAESVLKDKKRQDDKIHFILLKDIGKAFIKIISFKDLHKLYSTI